jgi:hypothetical protein
VDGRSILSVTSKLASFFDQIRVVIDISLDWPSSCVFRVWLRFLLFSFSAHVAVPVSRAACRLRPNLLPSSSPPSVHPNNSVNLPHPPPRRNGADRAAPGRPESDDCDSLPGSWRLLTRCLSSDAKSTWTIPALGIFLIPLFSILTALSTQHSALSVGPRFRLAGTGRRNCRRKCDIL